MGEWACPKRMGGGVGVLPIAPGEGEGVLPSALEGGVGDGVGVGTFAPESGVGRGNAYARPAVWVWA